MSVKIRERENPETNTVSLQADIHIKLLDGRKIRERSKVPSGMTRAAAMKWAQERERWLILHGHEQGEKKPEPPKMPTLAQFCPRFIEEYVVANRLKPSTIQNKKMIVRNYLVPVLGTRPLDKITEVDVQRLKAAFAHQASSSVNNMLTLLSTMLKTAMAWGVIASMPKILKLKKQPQRFAYYEDEAYDLLRAAARLLDLRSLLVVLLGAEAGLRGGEILALKLSHCDLRRGVIHVEENDWAGHVGTPQRKAGLAKKGPHILRHTFCSRLALRGATPKAIKELAGHVHSSTTDRYLHLAPGALRTAIDLLDAPRHGPVTSTSAHY